MGVLNYGEAIQEKSPIEESEARGFKSGLIANQAPIHGTFDAGANDWTLVLLTN
jgi:hypothetical protein